MSISDDNGHTWSQPRMLTSELGDCSAEFVSLPDGRLVILYCRRYPPAAIIGKVSADEGATWITRHLILRRVVGTTRASIPLAYCVPT